jgi:hypothetical protein
MKFGAAILIGTAAIALASCKGSHNSGSTPTSTTGNNVIAGPASNVAAAIVNAGPGSSPSLNTLYTSVTICAPGSTTNCQVIDDIAIDTSTSGLRIFASELAPALAAALAPQVDVDGNTIVECMQYSGRIAWGPVVTVDMKISGETAASLPIQAINAAQYPSPPAPCAAAGVPLDSVANFGANGILGVSVFAQDCGSDCALSLSQPLNPGFYYACKSGTCQVTTVPLTSPTGPEQVPNPVTRFPVDNDGVIVELPSVGAGGAGTASGALVFGIDTQTNNAFSTAAVIMTVDPVHGYVSTALKGTAYPNSYLDTGTKAILFDAPAADTTLKPCTDAANSNLYCPAATDNLAATVISSGSAAITVTFSVASADSLLSGTGPPLAFSNLAGPASAAGYFVWGMPFFYGRNVYFAIQGKVTKFATGPFVAF